MEADRRRIAEVLQAYDVGREIGRGAWGVVYAGHHRHLARDVAIKQLPTAFGADPGVLARFASEARLVASLDHPHIIPVYDYVERDGLFLIVMEYLSGGTLWQRFNQRGVTLDEAVAVVLAACAGLGYAHERRILHRDVKPDNLVLAATGTPKLTDFGIAKLLSTTRTALTVVGTTVGTPAYMAPEQAQAGDVSPATDVYACAVMLYELLAGTLPFPELSDPVAQLYRHVHEPPRPLGEVAPAVPAGLCDVTMRALAKAPADRYESAEEFGVALARAATTAWGTGWLARTDITVMDRGRINAATQHVEPVVRPSAPATVVVRGTGVDHPVLSQAEPWEMEEAEVGGLQIAPDHAPANPPPVFPPPASPTPPTVPPHAFPPPDPPDGPPSLPHPEPGEPWAPPQSGVLTPLGPLGPAAHRGHRRPGRRRQVTIVVVAVGVIVAAVVASVIAFFPDGDTDLTPPSPPPPDADGPPVTTAGTTQPSQAPRPPGRSVQIDGIGIEGDRYVVLYTAYDFTPLIDEEDPTQFHVHFFWNTFRPEQAGTNAGDFGATVGQWELWDQQIFDGFTVSDRPENATQVCAVVGTHDHQVENPDNHTCADLPT